MPQISYIWNKPLPIPASVAKQLDAYTHPFASILYQRGIKTSSDALQFLLPAKQDWSANLQLRQIDSAASILAEAVNNKHKIAVFGDYDADGITSSAILTLALEKISARVIPVLPNRFLTGYGLNKQTVKDLNLQAVQLIVTVDNGIKSHTEIEYANSLGMQVIVTDHHSPGADLPPASAVVNPKSPDDPYPNKNLAGVGVVYKLICALNVIFPQINPADYLDLVAIGTLADVVPLLGENRYLVRQGLASINRFQRQGLVSLLGAANLTGQKITSSDISYQIAPRLNSTGRLNVDPADAPLKLLIGNDPALTGKLAQEIDDHNTQRKILSQELQTIVERELNQESLPAAIISFNKKHHQGVAGISAGYLSRKYYLPAVVGQIGESFTTASCRSIPEFNLIGALDQCSSLFIRYGGHAQAAGFTISNSRLPEFIVQFEDLARQSLIYLDLQPSLNIDAEINLDQITSGLYKELELLEPTGSQNPQALFVTRNLFARQKRTVGVNSQHLKITVSDGNFSYEAIGFNQGERLESFPEVFDLAYHLTVNNYGAQKSFQLQIEDLKPSRA